MPSLRHSSEAFSFITGVPLSQECGSGQPFRVRGVTERPVRPGPSSEASSHWACILLASVRVTASLQARLWLESGKRYFNLSQANATLTGARCRVPGRPAPSRKAHNRGITHGRTEETHKHDVPDISRCGSEDYLNLAAQPECDRQRAGPLLQGFRGTTAMGLSAGPAPGTVWLKRHTHYNGACLSDHLACALQVISLVMISENLNCSDFRQSWGICESLRLIRQSGP